MKIQDYIKEQYPFEEYLKEVHSSSYSGTDDDMSDSFDDWLCNLDGEEFISHGNVFSKLLLELFDPLLSPLLTEKLLNIK